MKLGCMIYSLGRSLTTGTLSVPQALSLIKECGGEGVDISAWHVTQYSNAEVKQMVADAGLATSCYIGGANLTVGESVERASSLDTIRKIIDSAAEVGTSTALITTGACSEGQDKAEGRRNVAAGLAELLPHAKQRRVVLTIEDFGSPLAPYQTGAECLECCELAGAEMMITYDTGNMVMGDEAPVDFLNVTRSRVIHAHAKDWELLAPDAEQCLTSRAGKKYIGATVGEGVLDYPAIIAALKAMDYQGFVSFEYEGRGDPVQACRDGMAHLRELIAG